MPQPNWIMSVAVLAASGCGFTTSSQLSDPAPRARAIVNQWSDMGAMLPAEDVPFFAANLAEVREVLVAALGHPNEDVRFRAAYVIEEIGTPAWSLENELFQRLDAEPSSHVRIYLYNALRSIRASQPKTINKLRTRFDDLVPPSSKVDATVAQKEEVEERLYVAAALFVLDAQSPRRDEYSECVLRWLRPRSDEFAEMAVDEHWDYRWSAVNAVEHMAGADAAVPLLTSILRENNRPRWVELHLPRALAALESEAPAEP